MADIWCQVLGLARIGAEDNFFQIGGHSLLATQLVSRIHQTFELDLKLRTVFEAPTVAGLTSALARLAGGRQVLDEMASTIQMVNAMTPEQVRAELADAAVERL
jgi:hypothetical protein